jgi:hypothetical protein
VQVTGGQGCLDFKFNANTTQIQKKFVKSRVGDVVKHFKIESTQLEHIYWRFRVLKIIIEEDLKPEDCSQNITSRFQIWTVFKPYHTV